MSAFLKSLFLAITLNVLAAVRLAAQSPQEIVEWIYLSLAQPGSYGIAYLSAPDRRDRYFSHRIARFFAANDSHGGDLASACIDFALEVPGQDYDAAEILRTIRLRAENRGARRIVHAEFQSFGQPAHVIYEFTAVNGQWRIDDIAGQGWRLSQIPCAPATAAPKAPAAQVTGYCFKEADGTLRLDLDGTGRGEFELELWFPSGHLCAIGGPVSPSGNGWVFQERLYDGSLCQLELQATAGQGVRVSDPDHACKRQYCGQRAAMDGVEFPRATQVDCALVPRWPQN